MKKKIFFKKILNTKFKYKRNYNIRLGRLNEFKKLIKFIKNFWSYNHIFVKDKRLFNWQHKQNNQINFIIAEHKKTKKIHGILGLVSKNFFKDKKIKKNDDIWIAIIKVEKSFNPPTGLGTSMIKFLVEKYQPKTLSALGISREILRLYYFLGFKINYLKHFYIRNSSIKRNKIAKFKNKKNNKKINNNSQFELNKLDTNYIYKNRKIIDKLDLHKNFSYLNKRFINHPIYKYIFLSITKNNKFFSLIVCRVFKAKQAKCLRIIDIFNLDKSLNLESEFLKYITKNSFEYVDLIYFGPKEKIIKKIGFKEKDKKMILPNYFEPFVRNNIEISIAHLSDNLFEVFKADSDLDRPSKIR